MLKDNTKTAPLPEDAVEREYFLCEANKALKMKLAEIAAIWKEQKQKYPTFEGD